MKQYDKTDVFEGIDTNRTGCLHEFIICNYWYFLWINFRFQRKVCDSCHNMAQKSMSFNNAAIVTVGGNGYRIHFWKNLTTLIKKLKNWLS